MANIYKYLQVTLQLLAAFLLSVMGAVAMPVVPTISHQAEFFPHQETAAADYTSVYFAARAPPLADTNVAITGDAIVMQGSTFALHGQETVAALFGFDGSSIASNRGLTPNEISGASLPDLPTGYHYRSVGGEVQVVRNPGQAGNLPPSRNSACCQ